MGIIGKGAYANYVGRWQSRVWVRWSIEQEVTAIEKAKTSAIPIAVLEMFQQPPEERHHLVPHWARHDVYLSLVSGAKGIVVFSLRKRRNLTVYEDYYKAYARTAREICGEPDLGQVAADDPADDGATQAGPDRGANDVDTRSARAGAADLDAAGATTSTLSLAPAAKAAAS